MQHSCPCISADARQDASCQEQYTRDVTDFRMITAPDPNDLMRGCTMHATAHRTVMDSCDHAPTIFFAPSQHCGGYTPTWQHLWQSFRQELYSYPSTAQRKERGWIGWRMVVFLQACFKLLGSHGFSLFRVYPGKM